MGYKNTEGATMTALQRLVQAAENLLRHREALDLYVYLDAVQDALAAAKSELAALQAKQEKMCPQCGGEGCIRVEGFDVVTRDMAIDGGDERLEGQHIRHDFDEQCQNCGGTGYMVEPDYLQAAGVTRPEGLAGLFKAIDRMEMSPLSTWDELRAIIDYAKVCREKGAE